jgi:hypothetical protein
MKKNYKIYWLDKEIDEFYNYPYSLKTLKKDIIKNYLSIEEVRD